MGMYYNTIIGWAVYYFIASFTSELPWTSCDHPWNTNSCALVGPVDNGSVVFSPAQEYFEYNNYYLLLIIIPIWYESSHCRRNVLENYLSDGMNDLGPIKWSLALCVLAVFVLVYFSLWKGVRSTGKVTTLLHFLHVDSFILNAVCEPATSPFDKSIQNVSISALIDERRSQYVYSIRLGYSTLFPVSSSACYCIDPSPTPSVSLSLSQSIARFNLSAARSTLRFLLLQPSKLIWQSIFLDCLPLPLHSHRHLILPPFFLFCISFFFYFILWNKCVSVGPSVPAARRLANAIAVETLCVFVGDHRSIRLFGARAHSASPLSDWNNIVLECLLSHSHC